MMARILIVEDNDLNLELATQLLEDQHQITAARDGVAGVEAALAQRPDLILMDISLPRLDGFGAVVRLRGDDSARHIPIIALTAHAIRGDREKMLAAGFDDYVSKPIDEEQLFAAIDRLLTDGRKEIP
jgi:CheY-like chemotaxis protein